MNQALEHSQVDLPGIRLRSLNEELRGITRGARMAAADRAKEHRSCAAMVCQCSIRPKPALPLVITITRVGPRALDSDNLAAACKHVRDGIADWLGVDDGDRRLAWRYEQASEGRGVYRVRIRVSRLDVAVGSLGGGKDGLESSERVASSRPANNPRKGQPRARNREQRAITAIERKAES